MDWLNDLWTGFTSWWSTIDWGNAPEWLAAIFTSVSLFLALFIVFSDKRRYRRVEFMKVVPHHTVESANDKTTLKIVAYNANDHPIPMVLLHAWTGLIYTKRIVRTEAAPFAIGPKEEGRVAIELTEKFQDRNHYLEVIDSLGQRWYRGAQTNKPIHRLRVKIWRKRTDWKALKRESERQSVEKKDWRGLHVPSTTESDIDDNCGGTRGLSAKLPRNRVSVARGAHRILGVIAAEALALEVCDEYFLAPGAPFRPPNISLNVLLSSRG